jgi:hypothetical protein
MMASVHGKQNKISIHKSRKNSERLGLKGKVVGPGSFRAGWVTIVVCFLRLKSRRKKKERGLVLQRDSFSGR